MLFFVAETMGEIEDFMEENENVVSIDITDKPTMGGKYILIYKLEDEGE